MEVNYLLMLVTFFLGMWIGLSSTDTQISVSIAELEGDILVLNAKLDICEKSLDTLQDVEERNTKLEEACSTTRKELDWMYFWRTSAMVSFALLIGACCIISYLKRKS